MIFVAILFSCKGTIKSSEIDFAVKDTSKITKLLLYNQTDTIILSKVNKKWLLNQMYYVDNKSITRALNTLSLIELNMPLPAEVNQKYFKILKEKGLKIEIYKNDKLLKKIYLGDFVKNSGNYILLDGAKKPYIASIPFHLFDLRLNFSLKNKYWQSKTIFNFDENEISTVEFKDYRTSKQFYLQKIDQKYYVSKDVGSEKVEAKQDKVYLYFNNFKNKQCVEFIEKAQNIGKIIFTLNIKTEDNKNYNIVGYEMLKDSIVDKNLFVSEINNDIFLIVKYYDFDLIRKDFNFFK